MINIHKINESSSYFEALTMCIALQHSTVYIDGTGRYQYCSCEMFNKSGPVSCKLNLNYLCCIYGKVHKNIQQWLFTPMSKRNAGEVNEIPACRRYCNSVTIRLI